MQVQVVEQAKPGLPVKKDDVGPCARVQPQWNYLLGRCGQCVRRSCHQYLLPTSSKLEIPYVPVHD